MDEWGLNPGSFEAVGTVAAAVFAAVALLMTRTQALKVAKRELEALESETKRYARMIWFGFHPDEVENPDVSRSWRGYTVTVTNHSPETIYHPQVILRCRHRVDARIAQLLQQPRASRTSVADLPGFFFRESETSWYLDFDWLPNELLPEGSATRTIEFSEELPEAVSATLSFRDPRRVGWDVESSGSVERSGIDGRAKWRN